MGHQIDGLLDHGEVFKAQKVHFQQAHRLHVFHEVLGDHLAVVVALQGHQLVEGFSRNHHASGVDSKGFVGAFDAHGHIDPALDLRVALVLLAEFWGR